MYASTLADAGRSVSDLVAPTRPDHSFVGWFFDPDASGNDLADDTTLSRSGSSDGIPVDVPLYAGWEPTITTTALPRGEVDADYAQSLTATGGVGDYTWTVTTGDLPGGLSLGQTTGTISGTPTIAGPFTFTITATVTVTDANKITADQQFTLVVEDPACDTPPFMDVPTSNAFCGAISWLAGHGITTGYPDGSFPPGLPVSRQAIAAFLYHLLHDGADAPACDSAPFADVPTSSPLCGAIACIAETGILEPDSGGFGPAQAVARQDAASILSLHSRYVAAHTPV